MDVSFKIIEPNYEVIIFSKGNILFLIAIFFILLSNFFIHVVFFKIVGICSILVWVLFLHTKFLRIEKFNGKYSGTLVFQENELYVNTKRIQVSEIVTIYLRMNDYEGRQQTAIPRLTWPMSNGTNNLLDLDLKSGEKIKLFLKLDYEEQYEEIRPFIYSLMNQNVITVKQKSVFFEYGILKP